MDHAFHRRGKHLNDHLYCRTVSATRYRNDCALPVQILGFERTMRRLWFCIGRQSKTANALFALGLDARGAGAGVRAFSLHPGSIYTPLQRHLDMDDYRAVGALDAQVRLMSTEQAGFKTVAQGAATPVWCATSPQLQGLGGVYCEDCAIAEPVAGDDAQGKGVRPWATDAAMADRLWALSERLTGVAFGCGR